MPCGGIYPVGAGLIISHGPGTIKDKLGAPQGGCWVCGHGGCEHFCDEWDTYIHARCVAAFLQTEEGQCVIEHGHIVILNFSVEEAPNVKGKSS